MKKRHTVSTRLFVWAFWMDLTYHLFVREPLRKYLGIKRALAGKENS